MSKPKTIHDCHTNGFGYAEFKPKPFRKKLESPVHFDENCWVARALRVNVLRGRIERGEELFQEERGDEV